MDEKDVLVPTFSCTLYFFSFQTLCLRAAWSLRCGFPVKETFSILIGHTDWLAVCPWITFGQWQMRLYWKWPHLFLTERDEKSGNENTFKASATSKAQISAQISRIFYSVMQSFSWCFEPHCNAICVRTMKNKLACMPYSVTGGAAKKTPSLVFLVQWCRANSTN